MLPSGANCNVHINSQKNEKKQIICQCEETNTELSSSNKTDLGASTGTSDVSQSFSGNSECLKNKSVEDIIPNEPSRNDNRTKQLRRRITVMVGLMAAASIASLLSYFLIQLIAKYKQYKYPMWLSFLNHTCVLNSAVDPFILGFCNTDFRLFVNNLLFVRCKKPHHIDA
ncbi:hypothetical protein DPMN_092612 [Dreissena polymorpha]|uniref:G-protein coupled receptors family 1 profile domain-containing protein n=1 Tax=Dreissena polymorpha TaxID=45954 RepID=A0A9D4L1P7_DREPO|nr:hypothetical protein DPMN_092612 [Dreissena polymorpha]